MSIRPNSFIGIGVLGIFLIITIPMTFTIIDSGQVGVVTTFGKVSNEVLTSGFSLKNPMSDVHKINLRVRTTSTKSEAASSDLQVVHTEITLNYKVNPENAQNLFLKINNDEEYINTYIVNPTVNEVFKAVVAKFTAENLVNKREIVSKEIDILLNEKLLVNYISVSSINITNFSFSESFNTAIEKKVTAQQEVLTAQNNFEKQKIENQIKLSKAKTEADSLTMQKMAVSDELLKLRQIENETKAIEKWNGVLPTYTSNVPFVKGL